MQMAGLARWGIVGSLLTLGLIGCGSDSDGGSSAPSYVGEKKSVMIKAAEGGTVEAGAVALNVPEGALAEDTELSVEVISKDDQPDADSIAIDVYDFGPDGTKFLKPVTMEFDLKGVDLEGKDAFIAWLDGSSWKKLSDSEVEGGKITATTDHFTPFTVVLVGRADGEVEQTEGMCDASDFKACGGDLVGSWTFTAGCLSLPSDIGDGNGDDAALECIEIAATFDFSGDVTFGADGTISGTTKSSSEFKQTIDKACLAKQFSAMGQGQVSADQLSCDDFADADEGETPPKVTASGDLCIIEGTPEMDEDTIDGTYRTEGNTLFITDTGDTEPDPEGQEYCIEGNKLTLVIKGENGAATIITAERK